MCSISHEKAVFPSKVAFAQTATKQCISSINVIDNYGRKAIPKNIRKNTHCHRPDHLLGSSFRAGSSGVSSKAFLTGRCSAAEGELSLWGTRLGEGKQI